MHYVSVGTVVAVIVLLAAAGALAWYGQRRARHVRPTLLAAAGLAVCGLSLLLPEPVSSLLALVGIVALIPIVITRIKDRDPA